MTYSLFGVLVLFSAVVGYGLAADHANAWALVICTLAAVAAMQVAYLATCVIKAY